MTAVLGQTVEKAYRINENRSSWRSWYGGWGWYGGWRRYGYGNPFNVSQNVGTPNSDNELPTAIGKISIDASVTVTFLLD
jgi:hypothetical protein